MPESSASPSLSVVMPIYNEEQTIDRIVARVLAQPVVREVVAVDDGSTDGSWRRLQAWPARDARVQVCRHPRNRGKGAAVRTGLARATSPVVIVQDGDLEYDPADYGRVLAPILEGRSQVVYGSRFLGPAADRRSWHARGNAALSRVASVCSRQRLTDAATCYKAFRRELVTTLQLQEDGFGFCPELTAKLARRGVRILEVPVSYRGRTRAEGKKIRWRDGLGALRCILKYSFGR